MFSTRWRMRSSNAEARSSCASAMSFSVSPLPPASSSPLLVDDGDVVGRETGDGGCDEVLNRGDLAVAEPHARLQHDRGRRRLVGLGENLALGNDEMHARRFDRVERTDGAREFAFESAQAIDVLHEGAGAEGVGLVEDLVADAGRRQTLGRELHADARYLIGGNKNRAAVAALFIGDVDGIELGGNSARFARLRVRNTGSPLAASAMTPKM